MTVRNNNSKCVVCNRFICKEIHENLTLFDMPKQNTYEKSAVIYLPQYKARCRLLLEAEEDDGIWWFSPVNLSGMHKVNLYAFYRFGQRLKEAVTMPMQPILEQYERLDNFPKPDSLNALGCMEAVYASCLLFLEKTEGYKLAKSRAKV